MSLYGGTAGGAAGGGVRPRGVALWPGSGSGSGPGAAGSGLRAAGTGATGLRLEDRVGIPTDDRTG